MYTMKASTRRGTVHHNATFLLQRLPLDIKLTWKAVPSTKRIGRAVQCTKPDVTASTDELVEGGTGKSERTPEVAKRKSGWEPV